MRAILLALLVAMTANAAERITVPRAAAPKIDGAIGAQEWKNAVRVKLQNGGEALLQHDGTFLYIAFAGPRDGIGSLCVTGGDTVRILHASAALGTAIFARTDGAWRNTQAFKWTNRDTGDSAEAMAARKTFLDAEGWFANSSRRGAPEREYQLRLDGRREIPLTLAFLSFEGQDQQIHYWPPSLSDGCASARLASGFTEDAYAFNAKSWGVAVMAR